MTHTFSIKPRGAVMANAAAFAGHALAGAPFLRK